MKDEYSIIPERTMETLKAYVKDHRPTGGFLQAVLSNDLKEALGTADSYNRAALHEIVMWVVCKAPFDCQGSPEKYAAWIKRFQKKVEDDS